MSGPSPKRTAPPPNPRTDRSAGKWTPRAPRPDRREVWTHGWSADMLRRAIGALGALVAGDREGLGRSDLELAAELVRWLRWPTFFDGEDLSATLAEYRPLSPGAPQWDELDALVFNEPSTAKLIAQLQERYEDPGRALIAFLTDVAPRGVDYANAPSEARDAVATHRRAHELLFELGTTESLLYALSRLDLMDRSDMARLVPIVQPRFQEIRTCALTLWPQLSWDARADVVLFLDGTGLADERIFHLLMGASYESLSHPERLGYLRSLGCSFDSRVVPRLHQILDEALAALAATPSASAEEVVYVAIAQLAPLEAELTAQQIARALACGVRLEGRPTAEDDKG